MSFLNKLAEENSNLVEGIEKISSIDDELRSLFSKTFEPVEKKTIGHNKKAFYSTFGRIDQSADINMHQEDETPDVWIPKQGKLIRITSNLIGGK